MKKFYEKNEIGFTLVIIAIYCFLQSIANPLNDLIGVKYLANALINICLTIVLYTFIGRNGLKERCGLCKAKVPASRFLFYFPLVILGLSNLWNGVAVNMPLISMICNVISMFCIGFLEEIIFRGFLFKAMAKNNLKSAIIVSSITFGLGHILNMFNGRGMALVSNICQVVGAIAFGFLFVFIFHRSGSLISCILTHSAIDVTSVFVNSNALTDQKRIIFSIIRLAIIVIYVLIMFKTLPKQKNEEAGK